VGAGFSNKHLTHQGEKKKKTVKVTRGRRKGNSKPKGRQGEKEVRWINKKGPWTQKNLQRGGPLLFGNSSKGDSGGGGIAIREKFGGGSAKGKESLPSGQEPLVKTGSGGFVAGKKKKRARRAPAEVHKTLREQEEKHGGRTIPWGGGGINTDKLKVQTNFESGGKKRETKKKKHQIGRREKREEYTKPWKKRKNKREGGEKKNQEGDPNQNDWGKFKRKKKKICSGKFDKLLIRKHLPRKNRCHGGRVVKAPRQGAFWQKKQRGEENAQNRREGSKGPKKSRCPKCQKKRKKEERGPKKAGTQTSGKAGVAKQ